MSSKVVFLFVCLSGWVLRVGFKNLFNKNSHIKFYFGLNIYHFYGLSNPIVDITEVHLLLQDSRV